MSKPFSIFPWLLGLFDSPPLDTLTQVQKVGRVFLVTVSLVVVCILTAMLLALGIFLIERSHLIFTALMEDNFSVVARMTGILALSVGVNVFCVFILFQVRRLDRNLMSS